MCRDWCHQKGAPTASNGQLRLAVDGALLHTPAVRAEVALSGVCCSVGKMVGRRMMFCVIVGHVCTTFVPVETELALRRSASQPMKTHPYHFDPALIFPLRDFYRFTTIFSYIHYISTWEPVATWLGP